MKVLEKIGFQAVRQKGSHVRMKHEDNRVVTVPIHKAKLLAKVYSVKYYEIQN
ncbi:hypothetical protein H1P_270030 [Hyella patelloides LEGE 07179]|uniref:YcfA family protein n=1 Tax=Hyella patelloides LEGE 07179 TaxID=945734 RepID=A0A563VSX3_9CYAN|nr:type II toxin-antitoxin system HicA family toxin [Hyella patelloides]VEP14537.1 hypothetical protein H1P_270030 [Hyella patelloides LEGE 07179]